MLQNVPDKDSLPGFITQVHALKSASASVGAAEVSAKAAKLESAGKTADFAFIKDNLPAFAKQLAELVEGIKKWENTTKEQDAPNRGNVSPTEPHSGVESTTGVSPLDQAEVTKLLHELAVALKSEKADDIDRILEALTQQAQDPQTKEAIDKISDSVLMTEFDSAAEIVQSLLKG
jgi:hypothetical protein